MEMPQVNIQGICDHKKRFIAYDMGWPGSMTDAFIWQNSYVWMQRATHFEQGEWLLADRGIKACMFRDITAVDPQLGYPSSPYLLRPYSEPELDGYYGHELQRRRAFNRRLSSIRIYIEHVFGLLKSRFQSLRQLGRHEDIQQTYRVIQALMVAHNLCIDFGDHLMDTNSVGGMLEEESRLENGPGHGGIEVDELAQLPEGEMEEELRERGRNQWEVILNELFPLDDYV